MCSTKTATSVACEWDGAAGNLQAAREAQPAGGLRDKPLADAFGVPAPARGVLRDPSLCGGFNLGRRDLAVLSEFQVANEIDLQSGDSTKRGWLGALLGAVAEVREAGSSERRGEVPLNRVGSLEELSEVEHDWISFLNGEGSNMVEYARFADDLVIILIDGYRRWRWLETTVYKRLLEELATLDVELNRDKTRRVDLAKGESFTFLGFSIRRVRTQRGKWGVACVPKIAARTKLLRRLKGVMRRHCSQPVERVIALINPILRGWTNYFRIGQSSRCFSHVKDWVEKKVRRHLMRQRGRLGFGWKRWSRQKLYDRLGLFSEYRVVYLPKALPA